MHQHFEACTVQDIEAKSRGYGQMLLSKSYLWLSGVKSSTGVNVVAIQGSGEERSEGDWQSLGY